MCFPEDDDGVPPFCRHPLCPLDHRNRFLNANPYMRKLGHVGYKFFDANRKIFFGFASVVTVIAMIMTTYGCFALSTNRSIVQRTYWAAGTGFNSTSNESYSMYIGLRSVEYVNCPFIPGYDHYASTCYRKSISWSDTACKENPFVKDACDTCSSITTSLWITTFMSCLTLILSLLGAQTRLRVKGDVPVQKLLGMTTEGWGTITLAYALYTFKTQCYDNLSSQLLAMPNFTSSMWLGPGWICYLVCCLSALVRAAVHWVTPLPGQGEGLCKIFSMCPCAATDPATPPAEGSEIKYASARGVEDVELANQTQLTRTGSMSGHSLLPSDKAKSKANASTKTAAAAAPGHCKLPPVSNL